MHADARHLIQYATDPVGCPDTSRSMVVPCAMDMSTVVCYASDGAEADPCSDLNDSGADHPSFQSSGIEAASGANERTCPSSSDCNPRIAINHNGDSGPCEGPAPAGSSTCLVCAVPSLKKVDLMAVARNLKHLLTQQVLNVCRRVCKSALERRRGRERREGGWDPCGPSGTAGSIKVLKVPCINHDVGHNVKSRADLRCMPTGEIRSRPLFAGTPYMGCGNFPRAKGVENHSAIAKGHRTRKAHRCMDRLACPGRVCKHARAHTQAWIGWHALGECASAANWTSEANPID